jgi:hypothetical protein
MANERLQKIIATAQLRHKVRREFAQDFAELEAFRAKERRKNEILVRLIAYIDSPRDLERGAVNVFLFTMLQEAVGPEIEALISRLMQADVSRLTRAERNQITAPFKKH